MSTRGLPEASQSGRDLVAVDCGHLGQLGSGTVGTGRCGPSCADSWTCRWLGPFAASTWPGDGGRSEHRQPTWLPGVRGSLGRVGRDSVGRSPITRCEDCQMACVVDPRRDEARTSTIGSAAEMWRGWPVAPALCSRRVTQCPGWLPWRHVLCRLARSWTSAAVMGRSSDRCRQVGNDSGIEGNPEAVAKATARGVDVVASGLGDKRCVADWRGRPIS